MIDNLMALRHSHSGIRAPMLAYCYVLLPLIALALLLAQELRPIDDAVTYNRNAPQALGS